MRSQITKCHRLTLLVWVSVLPIGCIGLTSNPMSPGNIDSGNPSFRYQQIQPSFYPPSNRPPVGRSGPTQRRTPDIPIDIKRPTPYVRSQTPAPNEQRFPTPNDTPSGPSMVPQEVNVPAQLELTVEVDKQKQAGSSVTYQLTVQNLGQKPVEKIVVESEFDDALVFPGKIEKKVSRTLGRLAAQDSLVLALTLHSDVPGLHCCRFSVTSDGLEAVWKLVCVEFEQP